MSLYLEVLEYFDDTGQVMSARLPQQDKDCEIKTGAKLTVRDSQVAIFVKDGEVIGVFKPGRYNLSSNNMWLWTKFRTRLIYGSESPFRAEVYFLNLKTFTNLKWGTQEAILFRDQELDLIRLRACGIYSIQIVQPETFLHKLVGTQGIYRTGDVQDFLRNIIVSKLTQCLGSSPQTILDLTQQYGKLSEQTQQVLTEAISEYGLSIPELYIRSITPTETVETLIDQKTGINTIKDMTSYLQFKTATAIEEASQNGSESGLGLLTGIGTGLVLPKLLGNNISLFQPSSS